MINDVYLAGVFVNLGIWIYYLMRMTDKEWREMDGWEVFAMLVNGFVILGLSWLYFGMAFASIGGAYDDKQNKD